MGLSTKAGIKLSEKASKKKLIHDGRFSHALNQLAIKVYHLNPKKVDKMFKLMLVRKIWRFSRRIQMMKEGGLVGETLDRVGPESKRLGETGPPEKGGISGISPRPPGRGLRKQEYGATPGPGSRPQTPGRQMTFRQMTFTTTS